MKIVRKIISVILSVIICFLMVPMESILKVGATQNKTNNFNKSYTLTGDGPTDMLSIAFAQVGRKGSDFGYTENWCANFVSDCADLAGQSAAIPRTGAVSNEYTSTSPWYGIKQTVLNAGGSIVTSPQPGDLVIWKHSDCKYDGCSHVEIVSKVSNGVVYCLGGNTGNPTWTSVQSAVVSGERPISQAKACSPDYYIRPAYIETNPPTIDPNAPSDIYISGYVGPKNNQVLSLGSNCGIAGVVHSTHKLTRVWGGVYYRDTDTAPRNDCIYDGNPNSTTENLQGNFNNAVIFDYLPEGFYSFRIYAQDEKGYKETLKDIPFQVGNPVVSYTVTLNPNGGSVSPTSIKVSANGTYSGLPNPSKTGYTFAGWYTSDGAKKENGSGIASNSNHTLTARWTANKYKVAFNANGGSGSMSDQMLTYDQAANLTANAFKKTGYSFAGWNTKSDGSGTNYSDKASVKNLATSGTVTLYAKWSVGGYNIAYNANGGTGTMNNQSPKYDQTVNLTANAFTRTGYTFVGWNTKADGSGTSYADKASVKNLAASGTVTLYAKWTANPYTLTYNANGGTGSMNNQNMKYDQATNLAANAFTRTGYTFAGWNTKADGSGTSYADKASVKNLATGGTVTLYAKWTANKYTVKFDGNGADELSKTSMEVTYNSTYGELPQPKRDGYNFIGWYTKSEGGNVITPDAKVTITGTQTLYAQWSQVKFLITFNATGGTSESAQKLVTYDKAYGVLPTAERTGYTFKGWYLDEACTQQITSDTIVALTANQAVYAKWELVKYVITFDATGGVAERDSKQVTYGKVYGVLPSATKDGDEFIGWFTEDGIEITSASIVEIESDTTLYAKWESDEVIGDVNADGVFNVADVVMMQKWLLRAGGLTDWQAGDLCRDERIDVFDLCLMKRMLLEVTR